MAPSSSSAKKVAKLAQRGRGRKVRFQGGTLFPAVVVGVLAVGLLLIGYARQSQPDPGSFPPQVGDHWHAAYGMYVCDGWLPKLEGALEEAEIDSTGQQVLVNDDFATTGIHSHGDGVIHWHPYSTRAVGKRAVLGVFLDNYDVTLTDEALILPENQGGEEFRVDEYQCNGEDVEIKVVVWDNYTDTGEGRTFITDFTDIRVQQDGMVFAIAVVPTGTEVSMPPWAAELPELGAVDTGNVPATTVLPADGDGGIGTDDTAVDGADTDDTAVDTTDAPTTTGG